MRLSVSEDSLRHELLTQGMPGWHSEWQETLKFGRIPASWQVVKLGDVADARGGAGFPLDMQGRSSGDFPFIKVSDLRSPGNNRHICTANHHINRMEVHDLNIKPFAAGTVVFPKVGAAIANNRKRALVSCTIIDNNLMGVTVHDTSKLAPRFLLAWLESIEIAKLSNVSAVPSITTARVKDVPIPLPPIVEQHAIADTLDSFESSLAAQRAECKRMDDLKESVADALLSGSLQVNHTDGVPE